MEVLIRSARELPAAEGRWAVTLGTFDGVHRGHAAILAHCRRIASAEGFDGCAALSFAHHPRSVLVGQRSPRLLTTLAERIALLAESGIDRLVLLPFDAELAAVEHEDFVRRILIDHLGMRHFVLGHDVHFGKDRGGNVHTVGELAEREGFSFSQVASVRDGGEPISSTRIRDLVDQGQVEAAAQLLGHPFLLSGEIRPGRRLGRRLGFPTANLSAFPPGKMLPPTGVYAAFGRLDGDGPQGWLPAVLNVGHAPTVGDGGELRVETHLLAELGDLYGRTLVLGLVARLREERRFPGLEQLEQQIRRDREAALARLASASPPAPTLQVAQWQGLAGEAQA